MASVIKDQLLGSTSRSATQEQVAAVGIKRNFLNAIQTFEQSGGDEDKA